MSVSRILASIFCRSMLNLTLCWGLTSLYIGISSVSSASDAARFLLVSIPSVFGYPKTATWAEPATVNCVELGPRAECGVNPGGQDTQTDTAKPYTDTGELEHNVF